ncbi:MAG: hypothetical protein AAGI28_14435 [Pseudomonadota bacterium]
MVDYSCGYIQYRFLKLTNPATLFTMMQTKLPLTFAIAACLVPLAPLAAQDAAPQNSAEIQEPPPVSENEIVVTAEMEREAEQRLEAVTRAITRRPRTDKPIAKQYDQICVGIIGMKADVAAVIIERIEENAKRLDIPLAGEGCKPNKIIAFANNARSQIENLRKDSPWLFSGMLDYEYDRVLRGNGGAHAWQTTEVREVDGKPLNTIQFGDPPRSIQTADPFNATRLAQQIRTDMVASVVVFDSASIAGKTIMQLADYASIRSFANVDDLSNGGPNATDTILSLFDTEFEPPEGMTDFDWAYLDAIYSLPRTARGNSVHDAAWSSYRRNVFKLVD